MAHPARPPRWTGPGRAAPLAVLVAMLAGPALGQGRGPDPARPHGTERAWVEACVLSAQAHPPRAAFGRCAWRIAAACRGDAGEGLLVARLPALPERPQTLPVCTRVETAIWQQQMDRWLREVGLLAAAAAVEPLRRSQRAFLAWRDAACIAEAALSAPSEAEENRLACLLEQTALRALELKRLRDEAWLAIAAASAEEP